jgi:hypothetical protein
VDDDLNAEVSRHLESRRFADPALRLLAKNLLQIFVKDHYKEGLPNKRKQNSWALATIAKFLEENEFPPYIVHRFLEMSLGIGRLNEGVVDDWLKPEFRQRHRHVDSPSLWRARAYAAIALYVLAENEPRKLEKQSRFVAKHYSGCFPNEKDCTPGAVKQWRRRF